MKTKRPLLEHFRFAFVICLAAVTVTLATGHRTWTGPMLIAMFGSLALYFMNHSFLKSFYIRLLVCQGRTSG